VIRISLTSRITGKDLKCTWRAGHGGAHCNSSYSRGRSSRIEVGDQTGQKHETLSEKQIKNKRTRTRSLATVLSSELKPLSSILVSRGKKKKKKKKACAFLTF
jgi:hypothetical protein